MTMGMMSHPILLLYKTSNINDITVRAYISFWLGRFSSNQKKWAESSQNYQIAIKNLTQMYTFKNFDKQLSEPLLCESYRELLKSYFELKQYSKAENIVSEIEICNSKIQKILNGQAFIPG